MEQTAEEKFSGSLCIKKSRFKSVLVCSRILLFSAWLNASSKHHKCKTLPTKNLELYSFSGELLLFQKVIWSMLKNTWFLRVLTPRLFQHINDFMEICIFSRQTNIYKSIERKKLFGNFLISILDIISEYMVLV